MTVAAITLGFVLQLPPRWSGLVDVSGSCFYAIPPDWKIDAASESVNAVAYSPEGRATAVVVSASRTAWPSVVGTLRSSLPAVLVHEDSAQRFWIEYGPASPGAHHVAAVPAAGGGCVLYLDVNEKADSPLHAIVKEIVRTLIALR